MANPVITNLSGDVATFVENGSAILLDTGTAVNITDADPQDYNGGRLTISITANKLASEDTLTVENVGGIDFVAGQRSIDFSNPRDVVFYNRTALSYNEIIGRVVSDGSNGSDIVIDLGPDQDATPGTATTLDEVIALVHAIGYRNTNGNDPSALPRTITFTLTDGNGGSATLTTTVNVTPVNDPPAITGPSGGLTYQNASTSSTGINGNQTDTRSSPAITPDGKFVVFYSTATNLVTGDTNGARDIFVKNLQDGSIERVSVSDDEQQANGTSGGGVLSISANGRYILFNSSATNLVAGDTNGRPDIFLRDTVLGTTTRVTVGSAGQEFVANSSLAYRITNDGKFALFESDVAFVAGDTNGTSDLYVKNLATGELKLASINAANQQGVTEGFGGVGTRAAFFGFADMSDDGRYVVFETDAQNMVPGYDNGPRLGNSHDVFLKDMQTGEVTFVSERNSGGASQADPDIVGGGARAPKISADGRYVVFSSNLADLAAGATGGVFLWDRDAAPGSKLRPISTNASGVAANGFAEGPNISPNGRYVVFESDATNLVNETVPSGPHNNSNTTTNVFVKDVQTGEVRFVGTTTGGESDRPSVTNDGQVIAFAAEDDFAPGDSDTEVDVYVARFAGDGKIPVLEDTPTVFKSISVSDIDAGSGEVTVTFTAPAGTLEPAGSNGLVTGTQVPQGIQFKGTIANINAQLATYGIRYIPVLNSTADVMLTVTIDDGGHSGTDPSNPPDGSESATATFTLDLIAVNDTPVIVGPGSATTYENASVSSAGVNSNGTVRPRPTISADGKFVIFQSDADNLVPNDTNEERDIFVKNLQDGSIQRVSVSSTGAQANDDSRSIVLSISDNGRYALFASSASNLVTGDTNGVPDVFLRDTVSNTTIRVNVGPNGEQAIETSGPVWRVSNDGKSALFSSDHAFVAADTNGAQDIYWKNLQTGEIKLASANAAGQTGVNIFGGQPTRALYFTADMSADGRYVVFESDANNLVAGYDQGPRSDSTVDVFVKDMATGEVVLASARNSGGASQDPLDQGIGLGSQNPKISADGRYIVFESSDSDLVAGDTNSSFDVFLWDRDAAAGSKLKIASTSASGDPGNSDSSAPNISANGRYVVFASAATNLVNPSTSGLFVKDTVTGEVRFVRIGTNDEVDTPSVSNDGQVVAFTNQDNFAPGDTDNENDVYIARISQSGGSIPVIEDTLTTIKSISFSDVDAGNGEITVTFSVTIGRLSQGLDDNDWVFSPDGLAVTVTQTLAEINANIQGGMLRYEPPRDYTNDVPLTVTINDNGNTGQDPSNPQNGSESATATFTIDIIPVNDAPVIVGPAASNYKNATTDSNNVNHTQDGSDDFGPEKPLISGDGSLVFFNSTATDLVPGDINGHADIFAKNLQTGAIERLQIGLNGAQPNGDSELASVSLDGRFVLFDSDASNLVAGDTNNRGDVFLLDRQNGSVVRVNVAADGTQSPFFDTGERVSADGRFVLFNTALSLDARDTNGSYDLYVKDMQTGTFRLASVRQDGVTGVHDGGGAGNSDADMSDDGNYVVFESNADNFPGHAINHNSISRDLYFKNLITGELRLVSAKPDGTQTTPGFDGSENPTITGDGRYVLFSTDSDGLVAGPSTSGNDILLWDRDETDPNARLTRVSTNSAGEAANAGAEERVRISRDGHYIVFESRSTNLVSPTIPIPDGGEGANVFIKDLITGVVTFAGRVDSGNSPRRPDVSLNGKAVFETAIPDAPGDNDDVTDIYVSDPLNPSNGGIPVTEDVASPIRGISFSDVDSGSGNVTVTFTVPRGTLSATSNGGVTVSGSATALVLTGSVDNINAFLSQDRLLYTTVLNDTADVSLAVTIDDGGNSGQDPGLTGTATSEAAATTFTLTVTPVNDAPVAQDGAAGGDEDTVISGSLVANDIDSGSLTYQIVTQASHGTVVVDTGGSFSYSPTANYFGSDSFTFQASDGALASAPATVSITINPVNDAPVAADSSSSGEKNAVQNGQVHATDIEQSPLIYSLVEAPQHGSLVFNADGVFTYTPGQDFEGSDSFAFKANDAQADSNVATVALTVGHGNQAPINTLPSTLEFEANVPAAITGLHVSDVDAGSGAITTTLSTQQGILKIAAVGGTSVSGSGTASVTIHGTLAQVNAALAGDNVLYTAPTDFFGGDTLTMSTNDNGNTGPGGPLTDTDQLAIHLNTYIQGTLGDDSYDALPGNAFFVAEPGSDTIKFNFALVDATVTYRANLIIIDGPSSHTVLSGFETYVFTDGVVATGDQDRLVDDLFYYSRYHDVWNAHADADAHYHESGWHEGRDPSAFFDTSFYLDRNADVAAAHVDPLLHYAQFGWHEGRLPSAEFDPGAYLAGYPDVAAAKIDPLEHFLHHGMEENRLPEPVSGHIAPNGFDSSYYLLHNPDVAAAGINPYEHFQNFGWHEGRNPNALFDVQGYLSQYGDVANAGINPLDHYHANGWHEGRDPSTRFDTSTYLSTYADVAAANMDPLQHYLQSGIHEGRSAFADGVWG